MMPKATALWMIENTGLSFKQIADFCGLHELEVQALADGDVMGGMAPLDPVQSGQVTVEEIKRGEADPEARLRIVTTENPQPLQRAKGARYTPISKRQDKPDGIAWLLKNHPELSDAQVCKLLGTTKSTIAAVRDRTHWNSPNLVPQDPVTLGLCSQIDLDAEVKKAARRVERDRQESAKETEKAGTLLPTEVTTARPTAAIVQPKAPEAEREESEREEEARVFAKLKELSSGKTDNDEE
jgi:hypothetical protein